MCHVFKNFCVISVYWIISKVMELAAFEDTRDPI